MLHYARLWIPLSPLVLAAATAGYQSIPQPTEAPAMQATQPECTATPRLRFPRRYLGRAQPPPEGAPRRERRMGRVPGDACRCDSCSAASATWTRSSFRPRAGRVRRSGCSIRSVASGRSTGSTAATASCYRRSSAASTATVASSSATTSTKDVRSACAIAGRALRDGLARWEQAFSLDGEASWETNWVMELRRLADEKRVSTRNV